MPKQSNESPSISSRVKTTGSTHLFAEKNMKLKLMIIMFCLQRFESQQFFNDEEELSRKSPN